MHRLKNNTQALLAGAYMYSDNRDICTESLIKKHIKVYDYGNAQRTLFTQYPQVPEIGTIQVLPAAYIGSVPEVIIGTSFLIAKNIFPDPENSIDIVKNHFEIVRVQDMVPYVNKTGTSEIEQNSIEIDYIENYG